MFDANLMPALGIQKISLFTNINRKIEKGLNDA